MKYTVYCNVQGRQIVYRTLDKLVSHVVSVYIHRDMAETCLNLLFRVLSVFRLYTE